MANSEQPRPKKAGARVYFEDEVWAEGFTQIPNRLITMPGLDPDTKMVLITIMCHGWKQQDLPDQAEMAPGLNRSPRWLWGQIQELAARNIIIINRTGLNEANSYTVRRMSEWNLDSQGCAKPADSQGCANQTRNRLRILKSHTPAKQESQGAAKPSIQDVSKTTTKTGKTGGTGATRRPAPTPIPDDIKEPVKEFMALFHEEVRRIPDTQWVAYQNVVIAGMQQHTPADLLGCLRYKLTDPAWRLNESKRPQYVVDDCATWVAKGRPAQHKTAAVKPLDLSGTGPSTSALYEERRTFPNRCPDCLYLNGKHAQGCTRKGGAS